MTAPPTLAELRRVWTQWEESGNEATLKQFNALCAEMGQALVACDVDASALIPAADIENAVHYLNKENFTEEADHLEASAPVLAILYGTGEAK